MKLLRLSLLTCACLLGAGSISAQTEEPNISYSSGGHGFVEDKSGNPGNGITIPEDRNGAVAGTTGKTTNWTNQDAIAVHYFHHPAAEVTTNMVLKVNAGKTVAFRVKVYNPENLQKPLFTVDTQATGTGESQEIPLVKYNFPKSGYYRYCIECTSGCTDILEISQFKHSSLSTEATYKSGYLSSPSVHLSNWASTIEGAPKGQVYDWCYHEVMMPKESDVKGTYVMSMGLMGGYMGIQMNGYENNKSRHDIIFSIWDEGSTDINPNLPDNLRAKLVDKNAQATNERFGNEGTGMKSFMAGHFWECGKFVQFITNCREEVATFVDQNGNTQTQENTLVSAWFNAQDGKGWQYISTLRRPAKHARFDSWYSFLENYNWPTGQLMRKGYYRNGYGCDGSGKWYHFNKVGASHTDGERDAQGNEIVGKRYDYGFGPTEECVGPNGEKAFFMTTGGFGPAVENPSNPGSYECVVPLNKNNTAVDTINLNALLKRVDQAVANEKKVEQQKEFFKHNTLDRTNWRVVDCSSEETSGEGTNGRVAQIIDGDDNTYWHTAWQSSTSNFPHHFTVDMGEVTSFQAMKVLMSGGSKRHIKAFNLYVSNENTENSWTKVYSDNLVAVEGNSFMFFLDQPVSARYFKMEVTASYATDEHHIRINEINLAGSKEFVAKREELRTLIENAKQLISSCVEETPIDLTGRLSSNADQNEGGGNKDGDGVNALLDNNTSTYFHSRWGGNTVSEPHYIQVDLGEDMNLADFNLSYAVRNVANINANSPAPSAFTIQRSQNGSDFENIVSCTAETNQLPSYKEPGKYWKSDVLAANGCRFVRFVVTESAGPKDTQFGNQYFFGLSEFEMHKMQTMSEAVPVNQEIENAQYVYEHATVLSEVTASLSSLQLAYDNLTNVKAAKDAKANLSSYYNNGGLIAEPLVGGTNPGYYSVASADAYNQAYQSATELLNNATFASATEYTTCEASLKAAFENLTMIVPESGKFYILRSAHDGYAKDALVYANAENKMQWGKELVHSGNTLSNAVWLFEPAAEGKFFMKNLHTGEGVVEFTQNKRTPLTNDAQPLSLESLNNSGQLKLNANGTVMHAQNNGSAIVKYDGAKNSPSSWYVEEINPAAIGYQMSVTEYGFAGLYLNYNVMIPEGMEAYIVSQINPKSVHLDLITDRVIPARTAVIVKAAKGDYFFNYTAEKSNSVENNKLQGSAYTNFLLGEANTNYYLFGVKNGQVGLYKAYLEYDAEGTQGTDNSLNDTDNGGYFKVSANKVYLPEIGMAAANGLSFDFGDLTGIEELDATQKKTRIYDLQGRRIFKVQKSGLYIVNGQKVLLKK